jgi:formylmethanofuran dehydrogenase subunit E
MRATFRISSFLVLALLLIATTARAETPEQWIALGTRVHGFFGGFIPVGMRIGLDARERLKAPPRGLAILYYSGAKMPCPCIVDGVMLATQASPGQGTVRIAADKAPAGLAALILVTDRKTGATLRYKVADRWIATMLAWNKREPIERWKAAMAAEGLFEVAPAARP